MNVAQVARNGVLAAVLLAAGCDNAAPGATAGSTSPSATPSVSASASAARASGPSAAAPSAAPSAAAPSFSSEEATRRLAAHYARYTDGSSFEFYRSDWAPRVEKYLSLQDVPVDDLIREARTFYAPKKHIKLALVPGSVTVRGDKDRTVVAYAVHMEWSRPPPAANSACGYLDDSMNLKPHSMIQRAVDVNAELTLDKAGHFVAYVERGILPVRYKVTSSGDPLVAFPTLPTQPARNVDAPKGAAHAPTGTVVVDEGETFTCGVGSEADTVRKVRIDGKEAWLVASWSANTGRSWVGDTNLTLVAPDAGR